ncbi:MAG TPA: hypothetical protein DDW98_10665 [Gammaproteobacteria bacterium]|nr:hypothetical protein [Gammaproteobacteria bacterium]
MRIEDEFQEIGHCGGKISIDVKHDQGGRRLVSFGYRMGRPNPSSISAVWAKVDVHVLGECRLRGMGSVGDDDTPAPGYMVFIGSDSEGLHGHQCPACGNYWRSSGQVSCCPYCALRGDRSSFLTLAQQGYVEQVVARIEDALRADSPAEHIIDMDAVADAVGLSGEKPAFYYAEERQQKRFNCDACGTYNDVLGRFVYCCACGTRNDLQELRIDLATIRDRINKGGYNEAAVQDTVSAFDSLCAQLVGELIQRVPLTKSRRNRLSSMRFHNLDRTAEELRAVFDIDVAAGLKSSEVDFCRKMFCRRHVYEHNGGQVDEEYLANSGDSSVKLRQVLKEKQQDVHDFCSVISRIYENLHRGFHDLFAPDQDLIARHRRRS